MKYIKTEYAPAAVGPYSQAVTSGNLVFCSGQIGIDPKTNKLVEKDIKIQTRQVIQNLKAVLTEAGSDLTKVVKTTCYLASIKDYAEFNEIYAEFFTHKPARAAVSVKDIPKDALIEIEAIAEL